MNRPLSLKKSNTPEVKSVIGKALRNKHEQTKDCTIIYNSKLKLYSGLDNF